jgi:archaellum component FlaC
MIKKKGVFTSFFPSQVTSCFLQKMSQPCAIQDCKRGSRALCQCCNQNLCRDHFNEHDDLLNSQLNPLTDEMNVLSDRLTAINIDKIINESRQKLNQWRIDCHKIIDRFYEEKSQELNRFVNESVDKQRRELADLRLKMTKLIENQETTKNDIDTLTLAIRNLEQKMNEVEHIRVEVDIRPLKIDKSLIQIGKSKIHLFNLLNLSSAYRTINRSRTSCNSVTSNDRFLLAHIDTNLCLIDENLSVMKQVKWNYTDIGDMCWSSVLGRFVVITQNDVLLVDENRMSIERVQQLEGGIWNACGCSDKSLYLSRVAWDSSVLEFGLLPSIQHVKLWKITDKLKQEQRVDAITYNHGTLALAINDKSNRTKLFELRSSETFSPLWSMQLDIDYNSNGVRCSPLSHDEWLLSDWSTSRLFHITKDGKLKETCVYTSKPYNMTCFRSNILAILTKGSVNFHKL